MKPLFFILSLFFLIFSPAVLASAKSDYDYQYGQYRRNYEEFSLLKIDYLQLPSLDNQQKALLSAKQTLLSRDLTKASLAWYLSDLITSSQVDYSLIQPIVSALGVSREFYLGASQKSQAIITQADIKQFTQDYSKTVIHHDRTLKFGTVASKIATLVRIQLDSQTALNDLVSRLPATLPATVTARVQELRDASRTIDSKIALLAKNLDFVGAEESADAEIFFSSRVEKLAEIRTLQLDWISRLIDIDKNYAQSKQ